MWKAYDVKIYKPLKMSCKQLEWQNFPKAILLEHFEFRKKTMACTCIRDHKGSFNSIYINMLTIKALYPFPSLIPLSTHIKHAIKINMYCFSLLLHKTPALEGFVMGGVLGKLYGSEDNLTI